MHVENFTDAYHPEFVHRGTHEFAPSVLGDDGVAFTDMADGDNAIVRSVPLVRPDGSMMDEGWGEPPAFPPIDALPDVQHRRLTFAMIPPSLTMMFTPSHIGYTIVVPTGVEATYTSSDRVTGGGWLLSRATRELPDFEARAAADTRGAAKIWARDVPVNLPALAVHAVGGSLRAAGDDVASVQCLASATLSRAAGDTCRIDVWNVYWRTVYWIL